MSSGIRRFVLAAGAAALLSSQAAYAAPTQSYMSNVDPLVALSLLGTSQSSTAVCPEGLVPAAVTAGAAAAQGGAVQCVLPVTGAAAAPVGQAVPPPYYADPPKGVMGVVPMLLGVAILVGVSIALLRAGRSGTGNLTPISP